MQNTISKFSHLFKASLLFAMVLHLCSCLSKSPAVTHIPKEVPIVVKVNILSLAQKLFKNEAQAAQDFSHILGTEISDDVDKVTRKLRKSGLNILKGYIYSQLDKKEKNFVACNFAVKNYKRFNAFMEKFETHPIQWQDSLNYTFLNEQVILGWDEEVLILLAMPKQNTKENLLNQYLKLRSLPEDSALIKTDKNFQKHNKRWADLAIWLDMEKIHELEKVQKFQEKHEILSNFNLDSNYVNLLVTMKHGKVEVETLYFVNDSTVEKYALFLKEGMHPEVVKDAPVADPNGLLAIGIEPALIPRLFVDLELDDEMERIASLVEMEESDLINTFSGDFVLLMKEVKDKDKQETEGALAVNWHYEIAIGLALSEDRSVFDTLMNTLLETKLLKKEDHELHYVFFEEIFLFERENIIYLTKSDAFHESFENEEILDDEVLTNQSAQNALLINLTQEGWKNLFKPLIKKHNKKTELLEKANHLPITNINFELSPIENNMLRGQLVLSFENENESTVVTFYHLLQELFYPESSTLQEEVEK